MEIVRGRLARCTRLDREEIEYNFYAFVHTSSIFVTNGLLLHGFALDLIRSTPHTVQNFPPEEYGRLVENAHG